MSEQYRQFTISKLMTDLISDLKSCQNRVDGLRGDLDCLEDDALTVQRMIDDLLAQPDPKTPGRPRTKDIAVDVICPVCRSIIHLKATIEAGTMAHRWTGARCNLKCGASWTFELNLEDNTKENA